MTIGEALNRRSDLQKRIAQLHERLRASVLVQEGDEPPESAEELLAELAAGREGAHTANLLAARAERAFGANAVSPSPPS